MFAAEAAALDKALKSKAGVILANRRLESEELPLDPAVLWVMDARYAFAVVARRLNGGAMRAGVHASAVGGSRCVTIGVGSRIGPGVVLEDGVVVGSSWRHTGAGYGLFGDGVGQSGGRAGRGGAGVYGIWICEECGDGGVLDLSAAGAVGCGG